MKSIPHNGPGSGLKNNHSTPTPKPANPSGAPVYSSQDLFGSANEIGIEHDGFYYRLRITRQGKLILNK